MFHSKYLKFSLLTSVTLLLLSCGGGGSSSDTPSSSESAKESTEAVENLDVVINKLPIVNAGMDQNISSTASLILDGTKSTDSDGTIVSYVWKKGSEIISTESSVVLDTLAEGTHTFVLTVTDDQNGTAEESIEVRKYSDKVVKFKTNQGDMFLKMMSDIAPKAVENFVTHTKDGYYNGVTFHRVIKDFMIQGGDPTGTGTGGESIWGKPFSNEIDPNVLFDRPFILAMANAGGTKTNGSQFFITTEEKSFLNGKYTIFGEVVDGTDIVTKIENVKTGRRDKPNEDQTILKASIYFELK